MHAQLLLHALVAWHHIQPSLQLPGQPAACRAHQQQQHYTACSIIPLVLTSILLTCINRYGRTSWLMAATWSLLKLTAWWCG
jgi:hypothetical protein